jgi:hypothetical protein
VGSSPTLTSRIRLHIYSGIGIDSSDHRDPHAWHKYGIDPDHHNRELYAVVHRRRVLGSLHPTQPLLEKGSVHPGFSYLPGWIDPFLLDIKIPLKVLKRLGSVQKNAYLYIN